MREAAVGWRSGQSYSQDLRDRVIGAVNGGTAARQVAAPIFLGLLWALRHLAPTWLRAAGFSAGAWAATLYCLHCPEVSAVFVLTWHTLGVALAAGVGAWLGPRLLRW